MTTRPDDEMEARQKEIEEAATHCSDFSGEGLFKLGAEWADSHPTPQKDKKSDRDFTLDMDEQMRQAWKPKQVSDSDDEMEARRKVPLLCRWKHKWVEEMNILREHPFPTVIPSMNTFYDHSYQPRFVRTCARCALIEVSKQDVLGNKWWVKPEDAQYER